MVIEHAGGRTSCSVQGSYPPVQCSNGIYRLFTSLVWACRWECNPAVHIRRQHQDHRWRKRWYNKAIRVPKGHGPACGKTLGCDEYITNRYQHIAFNVILRSNIIPILGSHHTIPKQKMHTTSMSTHEEYIQDIHIRQGHAQPKSLRVLLT